MMNANTYVSFFVYAIIKFQAEEISLESFLMSILNFSIPYIY